jgi:phenylpyruvate tautomerase PptA (4-oxalocrotonate tautomerase family)
MPVAIIDIPSGLKSRAREQLHKDVAEIMHDAYQIPDNHVYLREWAAEHTSFDGVVGAPFRPICHYIVPPILTDESRRTLVSRVSSAVNKACELRTEVVKLPSGEEVSTQWLLQFFFEVPLEQAALDDLMASENPMVPKGKH